MCARAHSPKYSDSSPPGSKRSSCSTSRTRACAPATSNIATSQEGDLHARIDACHRQQELLVVVDAPVGAHEAARHRIRGKEAALPQPGMGRRDRALVALAPGAGAVA